MNIFKHLISTCSFLISISLLCAQTKVTTKHSYHNRINKTQIKSIQLSPKDHEGKLPVIQLNKNEQLSLSFDDLSLELKDYYISIQHCDANWQASNIPSSSYTSGYNEERITNIRASIGTLQPYFHYQINFPSENTKPTLSGNYIVNVYEDGNKKELIFTQRFYVYSREANTKIELIPSPIENQKNNYQKLNINCQTTIPINNPSKDLQIHVLQNQRMDNKQIVHTPSFIGTNEYRFDAINTFNFLANNEFRLLDLRTVHGGSTNFKQISKDSSLTVQLYTDLANVATNYTTKFDNNGNYYIRNSDNSEAEITSDYLKVIFSLETSKKTNANIYLVGRFNDFDRNHKNQLFYNTERDYWENIQYLKQGLYDYEYVLQDETGKLITDVFSGSYFATENEYQVLVYIRKAGTYWDELIDYKTVSIHNK